MKPKANLENLQISVWSLLVPGLAKVGCTDLGCGAKPSFGVYEEIITLLLIVWAFKLFVNKDLRKKNKRIA